MRVFVESNFVLELVQRQEQHDACEELLTMAEARRVALAIPGFALLEPYQTLERRRQDWLKLNVEIDNTLKQLGRDWALTDRARDARGLLDGAAQTLADRFDSTRRRLLRIARILPVSGEALVDAEWLAGLVGLKLLDAVMLGSIRNELKTWPTPSVFMTRDRKGFDDPQIRQDLNELGCDLIHNFQSGLGYLRGKLNP